jgi:mono-ADP-ribosyltransferase sirtuin 6
MAITALTNQAPHQHKMSAGYAERLKEYPNKGKCGLPENYDTSRSLSSKISTLAQLMNQSRYTVVLTGAGISTSAGIPDFRGPNGIWTREQHRLMKVKKKKRKRVDDNDSNDDQSEQQQQNDNEQQQSSKGSSSSPSFVTAQPSLTHRALAHLITNNTPHPNHNNKNQYYLQHLITQNIDGLHGKTTSLPRNQLSILHGDIFTEKCSTCHKEYIRNYEISTIGLQPTGRYCTSGGDPPGSCNGALIDTLLDWEDALPEVDWERSQVECAKAELILCLGTSLRIEPAGGLCTLGTGLGYVDAGAAEWDLDCGGYLDVATTKKKKSKKKKRQQLPPKKLGYVIVNLQETPYDDGATLVIRAKVDDVMERLMSKLGYGSDWDGNDDDRVDEHEQGQDGKNDDDDED